MKNSKPWWQSKTIWVNVLTAVGTIGAQLADALPPEWATKILSALAVVNLVLRVITTEPIRMGNKA